MRRIGNRRVAAAAAAVVSGLLLVVWTAVAAWTLAANATEAVRVSVGSGVVELGIQRGVAWIVLVHITRPAPGDAQPFIEHVSARGGRFSNNELPTYLLTAFTADWGWQGGPLPRTRRHRQPAAFPLCQRRVTVVGHFDRAVAAADVAIDRPGPAAS